MPNNSRIILRIPGVEPIFVSEDSAKTVKAAFEDKDTPSSQPFSVGGKGFMKSDIRFVEIVGDTEEEGAKKPHWVIYSPSGKSILLKTYLTYAEAKEDLDNYSAANHAHDYMVRKVS